MDVKWGERREVVCEFIQDELIFRPGDTFIVRGSDSWNYACELPNAATAFLHNCSGKTINNRGWWINKTRVHDFTIMYKSIPDWEV